MYLINSLLQYEDIHVQGNTKVTKKKRQKNLRRLIRFSNMTEKGPSEFGTDVWLRFLWNTRSDARRN